MKNLLFLFLSIFAANFVFAQKYQSSNHEIGFSVGVSNYLGDLGNNGSVPLLGQVQAKAFRPAIGLFYRNNIHRFLAIKAGFTITQIMGNDAFYSNDPTRIERNLHFRSNIAEVQFQLEWNILPYKIGHYKHRFTPYFGVGLAGYYFNPKAELNGAWVNLQPLGTEGQGLVEYPDKNKYAKMGISIPMSFGLKFNVGKSWALGTEFSYRYTFNDYLDDVSTVYPNFAFYPNNYVEAVADEAIALSYRGNNPDILSVDGQKRGNPDRNDAYFFINVSASFRIGNGKNVCPTFK